MRVGFVGLRESAGAVSKNDFLAAEFPCPPVPPRMGRNHHHGHSPNIAAPRRGPKNQCWIPVIGRRLLDRYVVQATSDLTRNARVHGVENTNSPTQLLNGRLA